MSRQTQVLVVGAGPTGLTAAIMLARLGIRVRIVDKNAGRSMQSKALGVQAGTLECLARAIAPDIAREMIEAGRPVSEAWFHFDDHSPVRIDLGTIPSAYNFILVLPQSETERILERQLNQLSVQVERGIELVGLTEEGQQIVSALKDADGKVSSLQTSFVIGCDGAHSMVRHQAEIGFHGGSYTGDFILGDVGIDWRWPLDSIRTFISERGVVASFPMKGERQYRLILIQRDAAATTADPDLSLDTFNSILQRLSQGQIQATDATWLARFRVHHRMVERFGKGRIFLAGDAAHIHSPAGGQGMNTGIQDALNLAFKLERVLAGKASVDSLAAYDRERRPVARNVVRGTDIVFKLALLPDNLLVSTLRGTLLPTIAGSRFVQRRIVRTVSEVGIARREMLRY